MSFFDKCKALEIANPFTFVYQGDKLLDELVQNEFKRSKLRTLLAPESRVSIGSCLAMTQLQDFNATEDFLRLFPSSGEEASRMINEFSRDAFLMVFEKKQGESHRVTAVSLFSIRQGSTQLLFIGVDEEFRRNGLGSFVICVVEEFSENVMGRKSTVCQLRDDSYGSVERQFWDSLYFHDVDQTSFSGYVNPEWCSSFMASCGPQKIVSGNWLSCTSNEDMTFLESIVRTGADVFLDHVPQLSPHGHETMFSVVGKAICKRYPDVDDFTVENSVQVILKDPPVPRNKKHKDYVEKRFARTDEQSRIWWAGDEIVEKAFGPPLFESNTIKILDKGQGKVFPPGKNLYNEVDEHDCLFLHLSFAFSNDVEKSMFLRRFLSYVNRCLGMLPDSHFFYQQLPSTLNERYDMFFRSYLFDHMARVSAFFDQYEAPFREHLETNLLNVQWKVGEDWYTEGLDILKKRNAFDVVSKCYLHKTFEGNIGDISFLSGVLGIDVKLFEGNYVGANPDNERKKKKSRTWTFTLNPCANPLTWIRPKLDPTQRYTYYLCRTFGTHFVLLSAKIEKEDTDPPLILEKNQQDKEEIPLSLPTEVDRSKDEKKEAYPNATSLFDQQEKDDKPPPPLNLDNSKGILDKIGSWLEWRVYKAIPNPWERVDMADFLNVGPSFTLTEYMKTDGLISHEVLVVMARMLDPLKCWIDPTFICPLSDATDLRSFVRLRPQSYLDDVILELYERNILAPLNKDIFLVTPGILSTWWGNETVTLDVTERLSRCSHVVLLNHTNSNHWSVVWILWGGDRIHMNVAENPLAAHLADSMNDEIIDWPCTEADKWLSDGVKRFIHHFLISPLMKDGEIGNIEDFDKYVTIHRPSGVIHQLNAFDCGVCSMMYLEKFLTTTSDNSNVTIDRFKFQSPFEHPTMYRLKMLNALIEFRGYNSIDPSLTKEYDHDVTPVKSRCTNPSGMSTIEVFSQEPTSTVPLCLNEKFDANEVSPLRNIDSASFILINNEAPPSLLSFEATNADLEPDAEPTVQKDSIAEENQNVCPHDTTVTADGTIADDQNALFQATPLADGSMVDHADVLKDCSKEVLNSNRLIPEDRPDPIPTDPPHDAKILLPLESDTSKQVNFACDPETAAGTERIKVQNVNVEPARKQVCLQETTDSSGTKSSTLFETSSDEEDDDNSGDDDTVSESPTRSTSKSKSQGIKMPSHKVARSIPSNVDTTFPSPTTTKTKAPTTTKTKADAKNMHKTKSAPLNDPNDLTKPRKAKVPVKVPRARYKKSSKPPAATTKQTPSSPDPPRRDPNKVTSPSLDSVPRKRKLQPTNFFCKDSKYFPSEGFRYQPDDAVIDDPVPLPQDIPRFASTVQDHQIAIAKAGYVAIHLGKSRGFPTEITDDRIPLRNTLKGIKRLSDEFDEFDIEDMIDDCKYLKKKGVNHLHYRRKKQQANDILYDPTQSDMKSAEKFARIEYEDTLRLAKQRLSNEIDKVYKNKKSSNELFPKDVFVRWMNGRAALNIVEEQMSYHSFFHPSDSIIAVGRLPGEPGKEKVYKIIVRHPENMHERGEAMVGLDFMRYFFEDDFVDVVDRQRKYSKSCFTWNSRLNEVQQIRTRHLLKHVDRIPPLYSKKDDPEQDGIMSIRAMFLFDRYGGDCEVRWSIACHDECKQQGFKYRPISKVYLIECVRPDTIHTFENFVQTDLFPRERQKGGFILEEHQFDDRDQDERVLTAREKFDPNSPIPYYKSFKKNKDGSYPYFAGTESTQISGVRYNKDFKTFSGIIELPDLSQREEILDAEWVEENVDQEIIEYLKNYDPNTVSYVRIPSGDSLQIPSHLVPDDNPIIRYRQGDDCLDGTCVFSSLCSILAHLGFEKSARQLNLEKKYFFASEECKLNFDRIKHATEFLMSHRGCKEFPRSGYRCIRITTTFDLLNHSFEAGEFALVLLWDEDGQSSHVVCVTKGLIFESNATHALHFSKESLDACSGGNFCRVREGRYFHKRQSKASMILKTFEKKRTHQSLKKPQHIIS